MELWSFMIVCLSVCFTAEAIITLPGNETIPALILFGDSIIDTGSNNNIMTAIKSNFPPYGRDFQGGIPTGRFSNGKVPSDFLVVPLSEQLEQFKEYIGKLKENFGEAKTNFILSKSLVLVVSSSNDIANTYFASGARKLQYDVPTYTDMLVQTASSFVKELYGLGLRRIGVFGAPPLGCLPFVRTLFGGIERMCSEEINMASKLFNSKLSTQLHNLNQSLPQAKVVYINIYDPLLDIMQNPTKYGFEVADRACCGTGTVEVSFLCNPLDLLLTCTDDSNYVFWDSYHPTQKTYQILVAQIINTYINDFS
ncbi:GDSL esterase/lipase EXL3, partial [Mucuna pruriens]